MALKSASTCVGSAKPNPMLRELLWTDTSVFINSSVQLPSAINISHAEGLVFHQHQKSYHQMSFKSPEIRHVCQEGQRGTSWQEWGQSRISVYPRGVSARSEPELPTVRSLTTSCLPVTWPGLSQSPPTATPALPLDRVCARTWGCRSRLSRTTGS